ncbi:MAG: LLM class flavin-dependent oxidoreductase [Pseudomonadota bacterium]
MKIGLFSALQSAPGDDLRGDWEAFLGQVRCARDVGFSSVLLGQHLVTAPMQMLQPMPVLARLASETDHMMIGPGILLLSMMNPVMVAEESATIDWLSGGRFVLAGGLGYRPEEFEATNVALGERASRLSEAVTVIKRLWTEDRLTHEGVHFRLTNVGASVRPQQSPRPPIWLGGDVEPAVRRAARIADAWLGAPTTTTARARELLDVFRAERERLGESITPCPLIRECFVGSTVEQARRLSRGPLLEKYRAYASWGQSDTEGSLEANFDEFAADRFLIGDVHSVRDQIERYREELGIEHLLLRVQWFGLNHGEALANVRRIGEIIGQLS